MPKPDPTPDRKPLLYIGVVVALVAVLGVFLAVVRSSDDDGGEGAAADALVYGTVEVTGDPLPEFVKDVADPAVGATAPELTGQTFADQPITIGGTGAQPTLIVFLAHWCPHCRAEVPVLVDTAEQGAFDGIRLVAVATGTNEEAVNFPPAAWLEDEGWPGEVLVDDQQSTAAAAYGLSLYPFLVMLDADGTVTARASGELTPEQIEALVATGAG